MGCLGISFEVVYFVRRFSLLLDGLVVYVGCEFVGCFLFVEC